MILSFPFSPNSDELQGLSLNLSGMTLIKKNIIQNYMKLEINSLNHNIFIIYALHVATTQETVKVTAKVEPKLSN